MRLHMAPRGDYVLAIRPDRPDWAALNAAGARVLERLAMGEAPDDIAPDLARAAGIDRGSALLVASNFARETERLWQGPEEPEYRGRAAYLKPRYLRELWVHINDRCNCECRHCLVSSGPDGSDGLPTETLLAVIAEAARLGATTFFITGGEPLLRPDLPEILDAMLGSPEAHAVVLTNGSLIAEPFLRRIAHLDRERLHLQISLDASTPDLNDRIRSPGAFAATTQGIARALAAGLDVTVATVVLDANLRDLPDLVTLLSRMGVRNQHLMWRHVRERGADERGAGLDEIIRCVLALKGHADRYGVALDNFENCRAIVNGEPGVKRDLTNACWDSLALYVDGAAYPSPALVGMEEFRGGSVEAGLEAVWRDSPVFERCRARTVADRSGPAGDPFLFLHGGGGPEHAHFFGRASGGPEQDPYLPLHEAMLCRVMDEVVAARMALMRPRDGLPFVYHLMGQDGLGCPIQAGVENGGPHKIDFTHSNCVLNQDVIGHSRAQVRDYYAEAAIEPKQEICCPTRGIDPQYVAHIPAEVLQRHYGCGSPVSVASPAEGEVVVDLGSGGGIECFIASRMVGPEGRVIGVDMTPEMLRVAGDAQRTVEANLGYGNVQFTRGYLEALPVRGGTVDVVLSNCVINLSPEKLKVFGEILRVLRPGGRMVISDIVSEAEPSEAVKYNPRLRGECIAGALTEDGLLLLLSKLGFDDVRIESRTPWREVEGVQFLSDTISARRPEGDPALPAYVLDLDLAREASACACGTEPLIRPSTGCLVCGEPLVYLSVPVEADCHYCHRPLRTWARCAAGHYVCDQCHGGDYLRFVQSFVAQCELTDPVEILLRMKQAYPFPTHGPEHHTLVTAAFLAAYRNAGGEIDGQRIEGALTEGVTLPGGTCGYWGACAAALAMGIAYSAILGATPLSRRERAASQAIVARILSRLAELDAPRCCRRESLIALQAGAECSGQFLPHAVRSSASAACQQPWLNAECIGAACPYSPEHERQSPRARKAMHEAG